MLVIEKLRIYCETCNASNNHLREYVRLDSYNTGGLYMNDSIEVGMGDIIEGGLAFLKFVDQLQHDEVLHTQFHEAPTCVVGGRYIGNPVTASIIVSLAPLLCVKRALMSSHASWWY